MKNLYGYGTDTKLNPHDYNLLIPQSALVKSLQFIIFGHTYPTTLTNKHLERPVDPFKVITNDKEWKKLVLGLYPVLKLHAVHDMTLDEYFKFEVIFTEKDYADLF